MTINSISSIQAMYFNTLNSLNYLQQKQIRGDILQYYIRTQFLTKNLRVVNEPELHSNGIQSSALEAVSSRFFLVGCENGEICLHDMRNICGNVSKNPIAKSNRNSYDSTSSFSWMKDDIGLFVTGSVKGRVSVWDTNNFVPVSSFAPQRNNQNSLTSQWEINDIELISNTHLSLIGVAKNSNHISLIDLLTGNDSIILKGHTAKVKKLCQFCEFQLLSCSADGSIRLWDIRQTGKQALLSSFYPLLQNQILANDFSNIASFNMNEINIICCFDDGNFGTFPRSLLNKPYPEATKAIHCNFIQTPPESKITLNNKFAVVNNLLFVNYVIEEDIESNEFVSIFDLQDPVSNFRNFKTHHFDKLTTISIHQNLNFFITTGKDGYILVYEPFGQTF